MFRLARKGRRHRTITVAASIVILLAAAIAIHVDTLGDFSTLIGTTAIVAFAAAAGDGIHSRRAFICAMTERARLAEETREEEARRRVTEERHRFARELHDAAAHQIAVITCKPGPPPPRWPPVDSTTPNAP